MAWPRSNCTSEILINLLGGEEAEPIIEDSIKMRTFYSETGELRTALAQLRDEIALLAAPASEQQAWLQENRYPVDELLLQLVDASDTTVPYLAERGAMPHSLYEGIHRLIDVMDSWPRGDDVWTEAGLMDERWTDMRTTARRLLESGDFEAALSEGDFAPPTVE